MVAPQEPEARPIDRKHPESDIPTHLLFQIGRAPDTVWLIGRGVQPVLTMGRSDSVINFLADVDLTPYNAIQSGVSRHHLDIVRQDAGLYVRDKGSRNGTALNDKVLDPETLYPIHDGDTLDVGALPITLWFVFDD